MKQDELLKLALAASPGVLALAWQMYKHFADRAEKRREQERQHRAELTFVSGNVESKPEGGSRARLRISNQGGREVILDEATFWYGQERFDTPRVDGAVTTYGHFSGIPLQPSDPDSQPVKPGHHRDYWLRIGPNMVAAVEKELQAKNIWITVNTTGGSELRLGHDTIGWIVTRLIQDIGGG